MTLKIYLEEDKYAPSLFTGGANLIVYYVTLECDPSLYLKKDNTRQKWPRRQRWWIYLQIINQSAYFLETSCRMGVWHPISLGISEIIMFIEKGKQQFTNTIFFCVKNLE